MNAKENPMQKVIARCWEDEEFKKKLMANPNAVLKAEGVTVPDGITINVVEDTERVRSLVIPTRPRVLSDEMLIGKAVAAGCGMWGGGDAYCLEARDGIVTS